MIYIVVKQPPIYHQMTIEEFLFSDVYKSPVINRTQTNTRTYEVTTVSDRLNFIDIDNCIQKLEAFNEATRDLHNVERKSLYREFYIPKKSGGLRKIDAPEGELMDALRRLKTIFEEDFGALYHTSAFAYVKGRSTLDAVKRHQSNESRWFAKYDLSNFFGSTTKEFVLKMFSMVYPFSEVIMDNHGLEELSYAIDLAFLDGGLPQGTPISPLITNIMMIPVDFMLTKGFRNFQYTNRNGEEARNYCVYTRYADDFIVSSKYDFDFRKAEAYIVDVLKSFDAPFTIKEQKTRYGSSAGSNWNLGVMLNKDNKITVGHKKKKRFQAMLTSFVLDTKNGNPWPLEDVQQLEGYRNYYKMVEGDAIDCIVNHLGKKFDVDIVKLIKDTLKG